MGVKTARVLILLPSLKLSASPELNLSGSSAWELKVLNSIAGRMEQSRKPGGTDS